MSNQIQNVVKPGVPWLILAFVLLTVLKVTGHLHVGWLVVTLPLWIGPALVATFLLGGLIVTAFVVLVYAAIEVLRK